MGSVDTAQIGMFVSYDTDIPCCKDTNNMLNETMSEQIQIGGSKQILKSFT
jgi:hypothetical protein